MMSNKTIGIQLLRLAPLVLTTSSLTFSFSQYLFFKPYLDLAPPTIDTTTRHTTTYNPHPPPTPPPQAVNKVLGAYVGRQFPSGLSTILTLYPLTWVTAAANLSTFHGIGLARRGIPRRFYVAGLIFNVAHLLWAPRAKALMEGIAGGGGSCA
jgi:hypothetical protein